MINKTYVVNGKKIDFKKSDYLAQGGQGIVYRKGTFAYKIYHDPQNMIPEEKIKELMTLNRDNILGPKEVIYDTRGLACGFVSKFIDGTIPIARLITKAYRDKVKFSEQDTVSLVRNIQETVSFIHSKNFLIVDLNELNFLTDKKHEIPYFLDVDSYQTPKHKASALMESVRDRLVKNNQFTTGSDWFSYAVVVFQLYIGIHPYKGMHPNYGPNEWQKRMDDGVSVLESGVMLPKSCRPFSVIPKPHFDWFKRVFLKNERLAPPLPDGEIQVVSTEIQIVLGTETFTAVRMGKYKETIIRVLTIGGENYSIGQKNIYISTLGQSSAREIENYGQVEIIMGGDSGETLSALRKGKDITICKVRKKIGDDGFVANVEADHMMSRGGRLYTVVGNAIHEHAFIQGKNKILHSLKLVGNCFPNSVHVYDGVIYQDALGEPIFFIPYDEGKAFFDIIKEVADYRIIEAKSEDNVLVIIGEKSGKYNRFVIVFDSKYKKYTIRITEDISYQGINFTKIPGKVGILLSKDDEVEIFMDNSAVKTVSNPPFDAGMKLFNSREKVFFINGSEVYQVEMKK